MRTMIFCTLALSVAGVTPLEAKHCLSRLKGLVRQEIAHMDSALVALQNNDAKTACNTLNDVVKIQREMIGLMGNKDCIHGTDMDTHRHNIEKDLAEWQSMKDEACSKVGNSRTMLGYNK